MSDIATDDGVREGNSGRTLDGRKVLVVGASTGLGRVTGIGLARHGAHVVMAARRVHLIEQAARDAGNGAIGLPCDVSDESSCQMLIDQTVGRLGGLDALVFTVATDTMERVESVDAATWAHAFSTNVTGATLVTRAALPHLASTRGRAIYFSSSAGPITAPWPGLSVYGVTKAALERLVDAWQSEHPGVGFTRLVIGPTLGDAVVPSQFGTGWDADLISEFVTKWVEMEKHQGLVSSEDLVKAIVSILSIDALVPQLHLLPRP